MHAPEKIISVYDDILGKTPPLIPCVFLVRRHVFLVRRQKYGVWKGVVIYGSCEAALEAVEEDRTAQKLNWMPTAQQGRSWEWHKRDPDQYVQRSEDWDLRILRVAYKREENRSRRPGELPRPHTTYWIERVLVRQPQELELVNMTEKELDNLQVAIDLQRSLGVRKS